MAGYVFSLGKEEYVETIMEKEKISKTKAENVAAKYALEQCILKGTYSSNTANKGKAFWGTFADFLGMKEGDDVYFFMERKIYGIGKLINVSGNDCCFRVHPKKNMGLRKDLIETPHPQMHQFVCTFEPAPEFFKEGVDMDEVLRFCSGKIRMLPFFSGLSFIKLDDIESEAIKEVIVRKNEVFLSKDSEKGCFPKPKDPHKKMKQRLEKYIDAYTLSVFDYMQPQKNGRLKQESYLEAAIMELLRKGSVSFGKWDFVGRQYPASPPKPTQYIDAMDLFGYRYVSGFSPAVSKYLVIELKKDIIEEENLEQTMKYVDWISQEYTNGDYSMIEAYTIGYDIGVNLYDDNINNIIERNYVLAGRLAKSKTWRELRVLTYTSLLKELKACTD